MDGIGYAFTFLALGCFVIGEEWQCRVTPTGSTCYQFNMDGRTWEDARKMCKRLDADLLHVRDFSEQIFISGKVKVNSWIGLNDRDEEGVYKWAGDPIVNVPNYENWKRGEPNGGAAQSCVVIEASQGKWLDATCGISRIFACSRPTGKITRCPVGWQRGGSQCYKVYQAKVSWGQARTRCLNVGGDLAKIKNAADNQLIHGKLPPGSTCWIGLNDKRHDGKWVWSSEAFIFTKWNRGEPNEAAGGSFTEDCAAMYSRSTVAGKWNDARCSDELSFICKMYKDTQCPNGWIEYRGRCFYFSKVVVSWAVGKNWCRGLGADYASVDDEAENNFLKGNILGKKSHYWLAANDIRYQGKWTWNTDTAAYEGKFTNWDAGQANNPHDKRDCVILHQGGAWRGADCNVRYGYICSKKKSAGPGNCTDSLGNTVPCEARPTAAYGTHNCTQGLVESPWLRFTFLGIGAVGGMAFFFVFTIIAFFCCRVRRKRLYMAEHNQACIGENLQNKMCASTSTENTSGTSIPDYTQSAHRPLPTPPPADNEENVYLKLML